MMALMPMVAAVLVAAVAAIGVSGFMWWATRRNAFWAMAAGVLATRAIFGAALLIGCTYGA
jgi:hypothetical protein